MNKVYMLTFHGSVNYGAVLQAYALNRAILECNVDCEVIDYNRIKHHRNFLRINLRCRIRGVIKQLLRWPMKYRLHLKFNRFSTERMRLTKKSYNDQEILQFTETTENAIFIVGSDQVWNCKITGNDYHYYLDFTESDNKFSYAASFGVSSTQDWNNIEKCTVLLKKFKRISVREETGKSIASEWLGQKPDVVCDPTFLLNIEQWKTIVKYPKEHGYVLLFLFEDDRRLIDCAIELARQKGLSVINIMYMIEKIKGVKNVSGLSPEEWLGYITNADYVITDSFHGFAFSLNFNKQIWVKLTKNGRNSRITGLAERLGIGERVLTKDYLLNGEINYDKINGKIDIEREKGNLFLEEILNAQVTE